MTDRLTAILVAAILTTVSTEFTFAQEILSDSAGQSEVRTSATAERSVRPDRATLTLSLSAPGRTPSLAGRAVAARADSIRNALVALGIPRDSLVSASRYNYWRGRIEIVQGSRIEPIPDSILRLQWGDRPIPRPQNQNVPDTTYRAHDQIEVRLRDLSVLGRVIDIALLHGITQLSHVRYAATDIGMAEEEALREATQKARKRAETIARANGGELGRTLLLSTQQESRYDRYGLAEIGLTGTSAGQAPAATEVVQPTIRVIATVYGRWQYVDRE